MKPSFDISTTAIQQFCKGDNQALSQLYKEGLPQFYLIAYRYTKSQQEAEDIVADCFEKLFYMPLQKRHQKFIEEQINLKALLLVMIKNKSIDVVKTKNNRGRIVEGIKLFLPIAVFNGAKQSLTDENFKSILNCLPEREKIIITLSMEGYTNKEVADQLGISEKTAANQLAIIRKKIKELWKTFME